MRTIGKILAMSLFAIFAINIASCSDSDDEVNVDFLEVEIEGVEYTKQIDFHTNSGINSTLAIVEESYGSEWYNWDTGEGGWNECQEELFRYKIIIP